MASKWLQPGSTLVVPDVPGIDLAPCPTPSWWTLPSSMWCRPENHRNAKFQTFWMRSSCLYTFNQTFQIYWKCFEKWFFWNSSSFVWALPTEFLPFIHQIATSFSSFVWKAFLMTPSWLRMWRKPWPLSRRPGTAMKCCDLSRDKRSQNDLL